MKTTHLFSLALLALLLGWPLPRALALNVSEAGSGDFPDTAAAAATYVLDVGSNAFSGDVNPTATDADYFKVTVLSGRKVTLIQTSDYASNSVPVPLYSGTYAFSVVGPVLPGAAPWGFTFSVAAAPDYEVTTDSGQLVVTDRSGNGETLTVSEPFAGTIRFAAPGRTFSLNGAAFITGDSGSISHAGIDTITVHAGAGGDTIAVGAFTSEIPNFFIHGGTGDDTVNFTGDITLAPFRQLNVDLQDDAPSPGVDSVNVAANANIGTSGFGSLTVRCSRSVSLGSGASLATAFGPLTVEANQQEPPTPGNFVGVNLSGATLLCYGFNLGGTALTVRGRGGNDAGGYQLGVNLDSGAVISGGERVNVNVTGTGGASTGAVNRGVTVNGAGARIESTSTTAGSVNVTGTGGLASANFGIGVSVLGGTIRATDSATVTVTGTGAGAPGSSVNQGVEMGSAAITSDDSPILVRGTAGPGASLGLYMDGSQGIYPLGDASITIRTDSLSILGGAGIQTFAPASTVTVGQRNAFAGPIDLGGADPAVGKLSLTDAVLDRIFTPHLIIGVDSTTAIGTSAEVSPAGADVLTLYAAAVNPTFAGTDVTLDASRTLKVAGPLVIPITGTDANTAPGYPQLKVAGQVNLSLATLTLTGTTSTGAAGNTFTLVENDGTDPIVGTFQGLPEGATLAWPASQASNALITYQGGDGNDVVITLVSALMVTTTADSGAGSLRGTLAFAASNSGADTVTFSPSLSGGTITLTSGEIALDSSVTIDASSLPAGLTISGNDTSRLFHVNDSQTVSMIGLTLTGGNGVGVGGGDYGGAIEIEGTLALTRCTLTGNSAAGGGGAIDNYFGTLSLAYCTLYDNHSIDGGALYNDGSLSLTHCTISDNNAESVGGGIYSNDPITLARSIVAGNSAPGNPNIYGLLTGASLENLTDGAPLLAPLGDYGGPTQTMALKPGSPAINAATTSTSTSDQRGVPIVGTPDIGAYEAGIPRNYAAWHYETLPAAATPAQRAPGFDYDGDGRLNVLEYATFTDGAVPGGSTGTTFLRLPDGSEARFTFLVRTTATDLLYELQRSLPGVGPWVTIGDVNLRTSLIHNYGVGVTNVPSLFSIEFHDPGIAGQGQAFYRLQVSVP